MDLKSRIRAKTVKARKSSIALYQNASGDTLFFLQSRKKMLNIISLVIESGIIWVIKEEKGVSEDEDFFIGNNGSGALTVNG